MDEMIDIKDRDPNRINDILKVKPDDILAEPEGIQSPKCIWRNSYKIYHWTKYCTYVALSAICFIPISFCLGFQFACISFQRIWCVMPAIRAMKISFSALRTMYELIYDTFLGPLCETMGLLCSRACRDHSSSLVHVSELHIV